MTEASQPAQEFILTFRDCSNILAFLDRVATKGVAEAQLLTQVAHKVAIMRKITEPTDVTPDSAASS